MNKQDHLISLAKTEMRERASKGLLAFTLYTKDDYQINWHHKILCRKLNDFVAGTIPFLMLFLPPRHGKSELVSRRLPPYIHGRFPEAEIMTASYSDSLAADMTTDVQKIMDSPEYQEVFPGIRIPPPRTSSGVAVRNSTEHHILGHRGKYRGQGVGGSFTGKGANFILIDDPIKGREAADSIAFRAKLREFYDNDLYSRLETDLINGRRGQILITQTRWHEDDLSGQLLELARHNPLAAQFDVVSFPAIRINMDNPNDPRQLGEALWPEKFDLERLSQIRAQDSRAWASLYQQDPTPDGGGLFTTAMFDFGPMPGTFDYTFIIADTAYNDKKENDFTVFTLFGISKGDLFVIDVFRKQIKAAEVEIPVMAFVKRYSTYGFRGAYIEPKGHGIYLNQMFTRKGLMVPSEERIKEFFKDRSKGKVERANNAVPWLGNKKIRINESIHGKEDLLNEVLSFPNGRHDDFVDTVIDGVKLAFSKKLGSVDVL